MNHFISGIPIHYYLILAMIIFTIGVAGVMVRRSAVLIFMSVELILNSVNLVFVTFSKALHQIDGEVVVFFCDGDCSSRGGDRTGHCHRNP